MKKIPQFKIGEVLRDKSNLEIKIVIIRVQKRFFNFPQKYTVRWYEANNTETSGFYTGTAVEHELTRID